MMKQKLIALACALALALGLVGCVSTPAAVGSIGEVEISSGLYLLAQFDAYQQAAQLAGEEQDAAKVKTYLKQTITVDEETGETAVVSDYVAAKTLEFLENYAAVETRFTELGGELNELQAAQTDSYAQQLMDQYGATYEANGIGLETLKRYERSLLKSALLLDLVYGETGETPVADSELTAHLDSAMYDLVYFTVPLYNTSTYAFADEEQSAQMLSLAQDAAKAYNSAAAASSGAGSQMERFTAEAEQALPAIYAVLEGSYDASTGGVQTGLLTEDTLAGSFTTEGAADAIRALDYGEAAAVQYSDYALMLALRVDPLQISNLATVRSQVLSDLKGAELDDALAAYGAQLPHSLDSAAMKKMPAAKIVAG